MNEIVERIEERRRDCGITRKRMCIDVGIPPTTYNNYIIRGGAPGIDALEQIASRLGTTVGYLRFGVEVDDALEAEMKALTERLASLRPDEKRKTVMMITDLISAYERKKRDEGSHHR